MIKTLKKPIRRAALLSIVVAALAGCGGSGEPALVEVPFERVGAWWAPTDLHENYVVRDDPTWQQVWTVHEPPVWPREERPLVDFSRSTVLGVTRGTGPGGCDGLRIYRVLGNAARTRVEYIILRPPPDAGCTGAVVARTDFVRVERVEGPVEFVQVGN